MKLRWNCEIEMIFLCSYQCLDLKYAASETIQREVKYELYSESFAEVVMGMWSSRLVKLYNLQVKRLSIRSCAADSSMDGLIFFKLYINLHDQTVFTIRNEM